jgi:transposase-like protein
VLRRGRAGIRQPFSFARHQFSPEIIRHAVWLYLRFSLSYRDVEELLAERGIETSYESVRRLVMKFGPTYAHNLRRLRPGPASTWHVDSEGEVLDLLVQPRRDTAAVVRLLRKLLRQQGCAPAVLVTDKLRSYAAACRELGLSARYEQGLH